MLSGSTAILIVALGGAARSEDGAEVAQPQPAYPPPPPVPAAAQPLPPYEAPPPGPLRPPLPSGFERRHHAGGQIGGTGILQAVYRFRAVGPVHLEAGLFGANHGGNFSAGVLIGSPVGNRWFPYVGFGGGLLLGGYPTPKTACDPTMKTCPEKFGEDFPFLHARVGIGFAFGATRRHLVSLDVGGWYGKHRASWNDTAHNVTDVSRTIAMPMAGLSYFFAIH